jgi:hypothetical protein
MANNYKTGLKAFLKKIETRSLDVAKDVAIELSVKVIRRTPEDTSRARANWNPDINTINMDFDETKRAPGGRASIEQAKQVINGLKLGNAYSIANSTPYIEFLELGSSQQAPAGFLFLTAKEFPRIAQAAIERRARGRS